MNEPLCDTKDGIQWYLSNGLAGLNNLIKARSKAGYTDGLRMKEWIILGRWRADTCGNFGKIVQTNYDRKVAPKDLHADLPDVLTMQELWGAMNGKPSIGSECSSNVPETHVVCPVCKRGWTIKNCHDVTVKTKWASRLLDKHVGESLTKVQCAFDHMADAVYMFCIESPIRNKKWIDLTPDPRYTTFKMNEFGSIRNSSEERSFKNKVKGQHLYADYIIKESDVGCFDTWTYYHKSCHEKAEKQKAEEYFCEIIDKAGWSCAIWTIPNEYSDSEYAWPWVKFGVAGGMITVGWRKRVIKIDWSDTGQNYRNLFKDEGVTLWDGGVHAWGTKKAIEYLTKIRKYEDEINGKA